MHQLRSRLSGRAAGDEFPQGAGRVPELRARNGAWIQILPRLRGKAVRLKAHAAASLPLGGALLLGGLGWGPAVLGWLASIFIDLDHLVDYVLFRKGWRGVGDFFMVSRQSLWTKVYFVCHGWESAAIAAGAAWLLMGPAWGLALGAGWVWHLALDQYGNPVGPGFYFLTYRALNGFDAEKLLGRTDPRHGGGRSPVADRASRR